MEVRLQSQPEVTKESRTGICAKEKRFLFGEFSRCEGKPEWAGNYCFSEGNGKVRIVHSRAGLARSRWLAWQHQVAKPGARLKKLANCLGEPDPHLHSPEDEATSDPHSLGTPDSRPFDVERSDDDGEKRSLSRIGGGDQCSFRRHLHSTLRTRKPLLYRRQEVPLREQSPLACEATQPS